MSISEVKVGSLIRVKVGRNLIYAKVIEILDGAVRVCSLANNKEFNVPESRVQLDGEQPVPANAEPQTEASDASDSAESEEPQTEEPTEPAEAEQATVEVVPEDEAAEFTPSGEDEEDEYAINPAHESDKPVKRMSLLNAAVEVLKDAGADSLRFHLPRDQREGASPHHEEQRQGQVRDCGVTAARKPEEIPEKDSPPACFCLNFFPNSSILFMI